MQVTIGFGLSEHDMDQLKKISKGNISETIREIINNSDLDALSAKIKSTRTTCKLDIDTAKMLKDKAIESGTLPPQLLRAAVETYLDSIAINTTNKED